MRRARFTIAGMMGSMVLIAGELAALQRPTPIAASVAFSLAVASCLAAVVGAFCVAGGRRAVWASSAICGSVYLALSFGPWMAQPDGVRLITVPLIECSAQFIKGQAHYEGSAYLGSVELVIASPSRYWTAPIWAYGTAWADEADLAWTSRILLHCSIAVVFATAGGLFSLVLSRQNRVDRPRADEPTNIPIDGHP